MPRKPVSTPTAQTKKSKQSVSAKISKLKSLVGTEPEKKTRGRQRKRTTPTKQMMKDGLIPLHAKEQTATVYEVNLTLIVTKRPKRMIAQLREKKPKGTDEWEPTMDRAVTTEQIVDHLKAQIFTAGTAQILVKDAVLGEPVELVQGIDALDVELLCQFFGVAK